MWRGKKIILEVLNFLKCFEVFTMFNCSQNYCVMKLVTLPGEVIEKYLVGHCSASRGTVECARACYTYLMVLHRVIEQSTVRTFYIVL